MPYNVYCTKTLSRGKYCAHDATAIAKQIANAHVMFNCIGVLVALPFTNYMAKGMMWLIPDEKTAQAAVALPVADAKADVGSGAGH